MKPHVVGIGGWEWRRDPVSSDLRLWAQHSSLLTTATALTSNVLQAYIKDTIWGQHGIKNTNNNVDDRPQQTRPACKKLLIVIVCCTNWPLHVLCLGYDNDVWLSLSQKNNVSPKHCQTVSVDGEICRISGHITSWLACLADFKDLLNIIP